MTKDDQGLVMVVGVQHDDGRSLVALAVCTGSNILLNFLLHLGPMVVSSQEIVSDVLGRVSGSGGVMIVMEQGEAKHLRDNKAMSIVPE